ncbi:MAG: serine kinase [Hyphomicrobiales bacterium]|nr:MAG: serine kinase [Hyphomicrobiales bacterium]
MGDTASLDSSNAHIVARDLIARGRALRGQGEMIAFSLPGIRIDASFLTPGYADLCRRAVVNDPAYADGQQQSLAVSIFDHETRPDVPRAMWAETDFGIAPLATGLAPGGIEGAFDVDNYLWQFFDPATGEGVEAQKRPGAFPPWVASFPLRNFAHWGYQRLGWRLIHAGTLAVDGRGIMLIGAGGSGKSGTSLAGVMGGLESVGDDYVAMQLTEAGVRAYPVIKLMKQDAKGLARTGIDAAKFGLGEPNWQNKYEFDFEVLERGRRARQIDLQAILLPRIAHQARSTFTRAPARAAMIGLAPSNLQQLPGGWREGLGFTAEIARRLPAYYLDLSTDPSEIADAIATFIAEPRS